MSVFPFTTNRALNRRQEIIASADATVAFTDLDSTKFFYEIDILGLTPSSDTVYLYARTSSNNGISYDSSASNYGWVLESHTVTTGLQNQANAGTTFMGLTEVLLGTGANEIADCTIGIFNPSDTNFTSVQSYGAGVDNAAEIFATKCYTMRLSAADVDAIQFFLAAGNLTGKFILREYIA